MDVYRTATMAPHWRKWGIVRAIRGRKCYRFQGSRHCQQRTHASPLTGIELLWGAGRCGTRRSLLRSQHHHKRARLHPTVEIDHILIGQPDAARRDRMSDPSGLVRAVDAIERVLPVGIKVEGAGAHWIGGAAFDIVRKRS